MYIVNMGFLVLRAFIHHEDSPISDQLWSIIITTDVLWQCYLIDNWLKIHKEEQFILLACGCAYTLNTSASSDTPTPDVCFVRWENISRSHSTDVLVLQWFGFLWTPVPHVSASPSPGYSPHWECNQSRSIMLPIFGTLSSVILGTF